MAREPSPDPWTQDTVYAPEPAAGGLEQSGLEPTLMGEAGPPAPVRRIESGTTIGRFIVLDELGAGGMGVVYAAFDPTLERKVAVKLLRSDDASAGARLVREAQALARLSHPNVVSVYEVGLVDERVFVAMEYVAGQSLGQWLEQGPRKRRAIIHMFVRAGRGLAAAHAADLVHRDFKPDNVLVGEDGRVRVVDFGLAAPGERGSQGAAPGGELTTGPGFTGKLTVTGAIMGTPAYMAPEQYAGATTDARTDQFSFCVSLYEALYGRRPFDGDTLAALAAAVVEGRVREPPPEARVPGWLRRILARGLATDPAARYPSMDALLRDLTRDRRKKISRIVTGLVVSAGLVAGGVAYKRALDEAALRCAPDRATMDEIWSEDSREAGREAFAAAGAAPAAWEELAGELDAWRDTWLATQVAACEATWVHGERTPASLEAAMFCLDRRRRELAGVVRLFADADAEVVARAGRALADLPDPEMCDAAGPGGIDDPERLALHDTIRVAHGRAVEIAGAGDIERALGLLLAVRDELDQLAQPQLEVSVLHSIASWQLDLGQIEQAEYTLYALAERAEEAHLDDAAASAWAQLVHVVGDTQQRVREAVALGRCASGALARLGTDIERRAANFNSLANLHSHSGQFAEAIPLYERALQLREQTHGRDSPMVANTLHNLGHAHLVRGELGRARELAERALVIRERHPEEPVRRATVELLVADILIELGELEATAAKIDAALTRVEASAGRRHPLVVAGLATRSNLEMHRGRLDAALADASEAGALARELFGAGSPATIDFDGGLVEIHLARGELDQALPLARSMVARAGEHPDRLGLAHAALGRVEGELGERDAAREHLERALEQLAGEGDPCGQADVRLALARALSVAGELERARALAEQVAALAGEGRSRDDLRGQAGALLAELDGQASVPAG